MIKRLDTVSSRTNADDIFRPKRRLRRQSQARPASAHEVARDQLSVPVAAVCKVALSAYTYSRSVRANEVDQTPGQEAWSTRHYRGVAAYMNTKNVALERVHEASGGSRSAALEMRGI